MKVLWGEKNEIETLWGLKVENWLSQQILIWKLCQKNTESLKENSFYDKLISLRVFFNSGEKKKLLSFAVEIGEIST